MNAYRRYRLVMVNIVYWFLLLYIIAALVWWFIALGRQSDRMAQYERTQVRTSIDSLRAPVAFSEAVHQVHTNQRLRSLGYIGEGATFLGVILVGALFVYRVVRREMHLSGLQQNFMMAVTHELKTPIAVAKLSLETLAKRKLSEEQQARLVQSALTETERLNQLSSNILLASQLEEGRYTPSKELVPFSVLTEGIITAFSQRFPGRIQAGNIQHGLFIQGDPLLLELAINNIVDNALKYSPRESPVNIRLSCSVKSVQLQVADQGEGIPDSEKSLIFRKFYRRGDEQTRKAKGTGLGLFLSRAIIRKHGGQISVSDNHPKGTIFSITFKEAQQAAPSNA